LFHAKKLFARAVFCDPARTAPPPGCGLGGGGGGGGGGGASDHHGAAGMSVGSGVHHGPDPGFTTRSTNSQGSYLFTSLRHRVKSDTGSSGEWNDRHREGATYTSKHSCVRHQRRELPVIARCSPLPRARTRPDLANGPAAPVGRSRPHRCPRRWGFDTTCKQTRPPTHLPPSASICSATFEHPILFG